MSYNNRIYRYYCDSIKDFEIILSESQPTVCPLHNSSSIQNISAIDSYKYDNYLLSVNKTININDTLQTFYTTIIKGINSNNILREIKLLYKLEDNDSFNLQFNDPNRGIVNTIENIMSTSNEINMLIIKDKINNSVQLLNDSCIELQVNNTSNPNGNINIYQIELIYEKI